jgi:arsenate reductase
MSNYIVYGIPNCDTIKKTKDWLTKQGVDFEFHNYKSSGITEEKLKNWLQQQPTEKLINRAGTTWKKLTDEQKQATQSTEGAIQLMLSQPSVIKRPVVEDRLGNVVAVGFSPADFEAKFSK